MTNKDHFRSSPRPQLRHTVTLRLDKPDTREITATTKDVSTGGLFVFTKERLDIGDIVEIDLTSPCTWDPLSLRARVCRVCPEGSNRGVGLQFVNVPDEKLVSLVQLIEALDFES